MAYKFSAEEEATVRTMWLDGSSDAAIAKEINRAEKSVRAKRRELGLTIENYPERRLRTPWQGAPSPNVARNVYTPEQEKDILDRHLRGESVTSIALRYNVINTTMRVKLDRLLERAEEAPRPLVSRVCLSCIKPFDSREPKKLKRICPTCSDHL